MSKRCDRDVAAATARVTAVHACFDRRRCVQLRWSRRRDYRLSACSTASDPSFPERWSGPEQLAAGSSGHFGPDAAARFQIATVLPASDLAAILKTFGPSWAGACLRQACSPPLFDRTLGAGFRSGVDVC
jgi:hypothetical protein